MPPAKRRKGKKRRKQFNFPYRMGGHKMKDRITMEKGPRDFQ
jgi:hypothetical protein